MNYKCHTEKNGSEFWSFNAAGVTYRNDDGSGRQEIISCLPKGGYIDVALVPYDYNGSPAYHINVDNKTVGNVPANIAAVFAEKSSSGYLISITAIGVHGGPDRIAEDDIDNECDDDYEPRYYGVHLTVKLISPVEQNEKDTQTKGLEFSDKSPEQITFERDRLAENKKSKQETSAEKAIRIRRLAIKIAAAAIFLIWIVSNIIAKL